MEIYIEVPSAATREALGKLGQWLGSESEPPLLHFAAAGRSKTASRMIANWPLSWVGDTGIEPVTSSV